MATTTRPARRAGWWDEVQALAGHPATAEVAGIEDAARVLADRVDALLTAHGPRCRCPLCRDARDPGRTSPGLFDMLAALRTNCVTAAMSIGGERPLTAAEWAASPAGRVMNGSTPEEALAALAAD